MNRRTFLSSLVAIPVGIVAAVKVAAEQKPWKPKMNDAQKLFFCSNPGDNDHWVYREFFDQPYVEQKWTDIDETFRRTYAARNPKASHSTFIPWTKEQLKEIKKIRQGERIYASVRALTG